MVYTHKEQVNKVYQFERAEKMADKQFLRQLAVATTKFLAVDGPGQITQALNDLVSLLFDDICKPKRKGLVFPLLVVLCWSGRPLAYQLALQLVSDLILDPSHPEVYTIPSRKTRPCYKKCCR